MALITISQSLGSGDTSIARKVAEELDLELFDDRKIKEKALEIGIRSEDLTGLDEKAPNFFDRLLSQKPETYLDILKSVVYEICRPGTGVVVGHGSQVLLQNFECAFHVLVHASEASRIETIARDMDVTVDIAKKLIRKRDSEHAGFFRYAFNMRWNEPTLYDLVVNPSKIGFDLTTELIIQSARSEEIKACSLGTLQTMEHLSMERRITAVLKQHDIRIQTLNVEVPDPGVALIRGFVSNKNERQSIIKTVSEIPGIKKVEAQIAILEPYAD